MPAYIRAISYHLPEKIFSNEDFFNVFPDARQQEENYLKVGVKNRRVVESHVTASDLAVEAGQALFREYNISPSEIDFVLFCALEFDYEFPASVSIIQKKLGISPSAGGVDYSLGCSGYVYGLAMAKGLVESAGIKNLLLLTSSTLTKRLHPKDKSLRFVFGDGAAATLISSRNEEPGFGSFVFGTDGSQAEKIIIRDGRARNPISQDSFIEKQSEHGNITCDAMMYMD